MLINEIIFFLLAVLILLLKVDMRLLIVLIAVACVLPAAEVRHRHLKHHYRHASTLERTAEKKGNLLLEKHKMYRSINSLPRGLC